MGKPGAGTAIIDGGRSTVSDVAGEEEAAVTKWLWGGVGDG